ncbi:MAG: nucleotidyltransferase domain-containing protein [Oligoflexia bacterium]|nr:nucleotidyltransferase domain-containing protein [Oligoflexia bacterium]
MNPTSNDFKKLPDSVQNYLNTIIKSHLAKKIILFGSRARGDFRENSDFDFAIEWENGNEKKILELKASLDETPFTLHKIDLLDLNKAGNDYLEEIKKEGKILWQTKD